MGQVRKRPISPELGWEDVMDRLAGPFGLTRKAATFTRGDVMQALCETMPREAPIDARQLERAADASLSRRAVALIPDGEARETGEAFRRRDGRTLPAGAQGLRYSTPSILSLSGISSNVRSAPKEQV